MPRFKVLLETKLTRPRYGNSALYDGNETIYITSGGGFRVIGFSISASSIEELGRISSTGNSNTNNVVSAGDGIGFY